MNSITDIISNKADELFENKDEIIDLEFDEKTAEIIPNKREEADTPKEGDVDLKENKIQHPEKLKLMIHAMRDQLDAMLRMLNNEQLTIDNEQFSDNSEIPETGERVIEGVFNGEKMVGSDGQEYSVQPNYASKSKLVEGDIMKLTITNNGKFIYKQISPIERKRLVGELVSGATGEQWHVLADGKTYKVLNASITFYKGKPGDEVVFFVAKDGDCAWGAVDNIIRK